MSIKELDRNCNYHILVVDDEETVAKFITEMLKNKGYIVTTLNSSRQALTYFDDHRDSVNLIITDQTMPEMTGAELAQSVLSINPNMKIFIVTGYSEEIDSERAYQLGIKEYLAKPLRLSDLAEKVQRHLAA